MSIAALASSRNAKRVLTFASSVGLAAVSFGLAGVGPASASAACTLTQGMDFTSRATLQTALSASTCPSTLTVQFTTGFSMAGSALSWSTAIPLVLQGASASSTTLDGQGASGILDSTSGQPVTVKNLTMTGGNAISGGAVNTNSDATLVGVILTGNTATGTGGADGGGAVYSNNTTVTDSTITSNSTSGGAGGGGIASNDAVITNSSISGNSSSAGSGGGGGVAAYGDVTVVGSSISGNSTGSNGGAILGEAITVTGSSLGNNTAAGYGGATDSGSDGTGHNVTISESTVSGNTAALGGGAVMATAGSGTAVTVTDSTVSGNTAANGQGGGILSFTDLVSISGSTISGNTATSLGGGIRSASLVAVTNSTLTGNHSDTYGGAISGGGSWSTSLKFATVVANSANSGAANIGRETASTLTSVGSVIATSNGAASCEGVTADAGSSYNVLLSVDSSCGLSGGTNASSTWTDLALGPLAVNGSSSGTMTMLPGLGSSLIDVVPSATGQASIGPDATDQRGVTRGGEFWVGAAQGSGLAQSPVGGCVTKPGGIPATGTRKLMEADCETNAAQAVGVAVSATERGDAGYYKLRCKITKKKSRGTSATGYGDGSRYCKSGRMTIRTFGTSLKLRIKWRAPATASFAAYSAAKTYRN